MADAGFVARIAVCGPNPAYPGFTISQPVKTTALQQGFCPSGQYYQLGNAYVLHPSAKDQIDQMLAPFDYALAAQFWGVAFTSVLSLHLISHCIGLVLNLLKRG